MSSSNGFRRCDGFVGSVPQNFINANMPVCPMCGTNDPYWLLKDKMEWTANRILFRCSKCGCILSATNSDFTGATKSTAFAVLSTAGAVNALTKKAQGKDVKTIYMRVEDVGDCQTSTALNGREMPIEELKEMAAAFSLRAAAPAAVPAPEAASEFKVSYGAPAAAPAAEPAPVFTESPAAPAPAVEPVPAAEPEFKVSYGAPAAAPAAEPAPTFTEAPAAAPAPAVEPAPAAEPEFKVTYAAPAAAPAAEPAPAFTEAPAAPAPAVEPAPAAEPEFKVSYAAPAAEPAPAPEFRVQYAAPAAPAAPAPKPQKYVLKEKTPVFAIILMGIAILTSLIRFIGSFTNFGGAVGVFNGFVALGATALMFVGMILHRKKGQVLTAVGSLCMALVSFISVVTSLGGYVSWTILIDVFAVAAFVIAGIYYLTKAPVLGMPLKMIAFLLFVTLLTVHLLSMGRYLFRGYLPGYIIVSWLGEYFLAVAMIIYTPFKRNRV